MANKATKKKNSAKKTRNAKNPKRTKLVKPIRETATGEPFTPYSKEAQVGRKKK